MAIVLIGESASGKSTLERTLCDKYGYQRVISYTTRPMRDGEVCGVDYHFCTDETFNKMLHSGQLAEHTTYRGWQYGIAKEDLSDNKIIVVEPNGLKQLQAIPNLNLKVFYLDVPRRDRLIKILQRGDDVDEAIRRNTSDAKLFKGLRADFVIRNSRYGYSPEELAEFVVGELEGVNE